MRKFNISSLPMPTAYTAVASIGAKPRKQRQSAKWTMVGTWLLLLVFAATTNGFSNYWQVLRNLLSLDATMAQLHSGEFTTMAPTIAAMVVIALVVIIPVVMLVTKLVPLKDTDKEVHKEGHDTMLGGQKPKEQYAVIMATLTFEEVLARLLFLGVIGQIAWFANSNIAFYALFFAGNLIWALIHLGNLKKDGKPFPDLKWYEMIVFVMPQFVIGILITAVYLPYGFLGAVIAHVAYDMVLFCSDRVDVFNLGEKLICVYHAIVGGTALTYFLVVGKQSLFDMKLWLNDSLTSFALPGWGFWDYTSAIVALTSFTILALELLFYDREGGETKKELIRDWLYAGAFLLIAYFIVKATQGMTYLPMAGVVVVMALLGALLVRSRSGSAIARLFWESVLGSSVVICGLLAMDERHGLYLVMLLMALWLPDRIIRYLDKDDLPDNEDDKEDKEETPAKAIKTGPALVATQ